MPIIENWNIRSRAHQCAVLATPFVDSEPFYTALFENAKGELLRLDYSLEGWKQAQAGWPADSPERPFSFWKSEYEQALREAKAEVVEKEGAEGLLRRLIEEENPGTENTRYILAIMLERKKILRPTGARETEDATFLIYENPKTSEVYLIRDPELRLDQVEMVQREVSLLLMSQQNSEPPPETTPPPAETTASPQPDPAVETTDTQP